MIEKAFPEILGEIHAKEIPGKIYANPDAKAVTEESFMSSGVRDPHTLALRDNVPWRREKVGPVELNAVSVEQSLKEIDPQRFWLQTLWAREHSAIAVEALHSTTAPSQHHREAHPETPVARTYYRTRHATQAMALPHGRQHTPSSAVSGRHEPFGAGLRGRQQMAPPWNGVCIWSELRSARCRSI